MKVKEIRFVQAGLGGGHAQARVIEIPGNKAGEGQEPVPDDTPLSDWQPAPQGIEKEE